MGRSDSPHGRSKGGGLGLDPGHADARRFTELYRTHHQRIYEFACRRVGREVATEIVSETFLVAWRKLADVPESPLPWLYRVASYEVANQRRRQRRVDQLRADMELLQRHTLTTDAPVGLPDQVAVAFDSLSPADQEILRLSTWEGLSLAEGASVLECSIAAYRMRLHRARLRLGKKVGREQADSRRGADDATVIAFAGEPIGLRITGAGVAL